jgi:hypothetical protein
MYLTIFIILQVIAVCALVASFLTKSTLVSAVSMVTSGMLMVGAWVINVGQEYVWNAAIRAYEPSIIYITTPYLASFNMLIFSLSLVFFFTDLFDVIKNEAKTIDKKIESAGHSGV